MSHLQLCTYSVKLVEKLKVLDTKHLLDFALIDKATCWAKKYHAGQFRKSGEPYYTHPLAVAYIVADFNLTTEVIVASILHDLLEDTEATKGMLTRAFGPRGLLRWLTCLLVIN